MHKKLVPNPCKSICKIKDNFCIGCKRSKEEISKWPTLSTEDRLIIVNRIKDDKVND
jgi:predicted Fe-S protein YdhL (DUF1289 family)